MTETPTIYDATPTSAVEKKRGASWGMAAVLFLLFLCNVVTIAGSVWLWQQLSLSNHTAQTTQQALTEQTEKSSTLKNAVEKQAEEAKLFRQKVTDILSDNSEKLRSLDRIDTSYWRLAEAEFLLKQAHQRLFITHDADTADLLLASAEAAIMQQKDPGLLPVRSAIAKDRVALKNVPRVDRDSLYLRLQALSSQVGMLTSNNRFLRADDETGVDTEAEEKSYVDVLWERLLSIVRIRHYDQPVEPLLPPEQQLYFSQNLQLALLQSQLGLLQSQQETYASNLARAHAWVNQYCQTSDPVVAEWLNEAQALMRIEIAPPMPNISDSLAIVQKLIEQRADEIRKALMLGDDTDVDADDAAQELP